MDRRPVGTVYLLKRAELAVRGCMEVALAEFELTPAQFLMLFRMRDCAEVSAAELARDIGVRPQSLISLIAPLERAGILEREPSPRHRRILHMRLSAGGKRLVGDAMRVATRVESELLSALDEAHLAVLHEALVALRDRAEGHELHPGSIRARAQELMRAQLGLRRRGVKSQASPQERPGRARSSAPRTRRSADRARARDDR